MHSYREINSFDSIRNKSDFGSMSRRGREEVVEGMKTESEMVMYMMISVQYLLLTDVRTKYLLPLSLSLYDYFNSFSPSTGDK